MVHVIVVHTFNQGTSYTRSGMTISFSKMFDFSAMFSSRRRHSPYFVKIVFFFPFGGHQFCRMSTHGWSF